MYLVLIANAPEIRPAEIKGMSQVMMEMMGPEQFKLMGLPMVTDLMDMGMILMMRDCIIRFIFRMREK